MSAQTESTRNQTASAGFEWFCIGLSAPALVIQAFVAATLWAWFMVPLGVPGIGMAHAFGLVVLARFVRGGGNLPYSRTQWECVAGLMKSYLWPTFSIAFGAVAYLLMVTS